MNSLTRLRKWISDHLIETLGISLLVLSLIAIFGGYFFSRYWYDIAKLTVPDFVQEMFSNFGTELLSIAITILLIDWLNKRRQDRDKKAELIRDLGSKTNDFALRAARELRARGWHQDVSLQGAYLVGANLTNAGLEGVILTNAKLWGTTLVQTNLARADLTHANLERTDMKRVHLEEANLTSASLVLANLTHAVLWSTNLTHANLERANLTGACLGESDLTNASLRKATLINVNLEGAIYDNTTKWPEGFDPKAAGAINVDEQAPKEEIS